MKKSWIIKHLLFAGFMIYVSFSGYANIHSKPIKNMDSRETNKFSLGPQEVLAVEEVASQMKDSLQDLGAGDIRGVFVLPEKENVSSEPARGERMVRVAFLDTMGECFIYDSITKEMILCDEEDKALVKGSEEILISSLSDTPVNYSFIPEGSLQTAGVRDFICPYRSAITLGVLYGGAGILLGALTGVSGGTVLATLVGGVVLGVVVGALDPDLKSGTVGDLTTMTGTALATALAGGKSLTTGGLIITGGIFALHLACDFNYYP